MNDAAASGPLSEHLASMAVALDRFLNFDHCDAMRNVDVWKPALGGDLPVTGLGIEQTLELMNQFLIPNGSQVPKPGCTSFITTGASSLGAIATLAGAVASPQRFGLTAFNYLEGLSLDWLATVFGLHKRMQGVYSSGGSTANLLALGAARQWAFEKSGHDASEHGVNTPCRVYTSTAVHKTIQRACAGTGVRSPCGRADSG